jgi:hypothetical protein
MGPSNLAMSASPNWPPFAANSAFQSSAICTLKATSRFRLMPRRHANFDASSPKATLPPAF